ncbi:MAG: hypothetical protein CM15mP23_12400 [Cryomorphaceae bacterium]|nr:MAG: hypothetical protein CM15mP23_12400 [Cryomorphaceae bacterium]
MPITLIITEHFFLMGGNEMLENGFLLLREDSSLTSPISMLHYEFYNDLDELKERLSF